MPSIIHSARRAGSIALFVLLCSAVPALAQQNCGNDKPVGNAQHCKNDLPSLPSLPPLPNLTATPELDSLFLLGTGLTGLGGYAVLRLRAGRRNQS